ncbi:MAG: HlyC/CorC family transporter [Muribaculaceae bacterium]|nr:HlyC/CorC family transporter [Muribaculaceae bacterium]
MSEIFIILGLILLNGLFSMAEIALISARKSNLSESAKKGNRAAQVAMGLRENPDNFLSTVQIGITLIGIVTGIYSGNRIASVFAEWLASVGLNVGYAEDAAQTLIVVLVTYLTLVFGELLPKRIGMSNAESVAKLVSRPMNWLSLVAAPFVWMLSKSTSVIFSLFGLKDKTSKVTEAEIISIVNESKEDGEIEEVEQDIVERVFLMGDLNVDSIMTHRRELVWLNADMTADEVMDVMRSDLYEMYPVAEGDLDHILGIVTLKDLVLNISRHDFSLRKIVCEASYFYCDMSVYKALETMKIEGVSRGLVCDEFGSCIGIVTLKDMMMALVGMVSDGDSSDDCIVKRNDKEEWLVDGQCSIYDFLTYFDCEELYENEDYTTVAGLCLAHLHHIPQVGETLEWHSFRFEVSDMDGVRIDKFLVCRVNQAAE